VTELTEQTGLIRLNFNYRNPCTGIGPYRRNEGEVPIAEHSVSLVIRYNARDVAGHGLAALPLCASSIV
jgi:hypothetical protein